MNKTRKISVLALVLILALTLTACSNQGQEETNNNDLDGNVEESINESETGENDFEGTGEYEAINLKDNEQGVFSFQGQDLVFTPDNEDIEAIVIPIENSEFKKHEGEASYQMLVVTDGTEEHEFSGLYEEFFSELEKYK